MANTPNLTDSSLSPVIVGTISSNISKKGAINSSNIYDFYQITLSKDQTLNLYLYTNLADSFFTNPNYWLIQPYIGNIQVSIKDPKTYQTLATTSINGNTKNLSTALSAGNYLIQVENKGALLSEDYTLSITPVATTTTPTTPTTPTTTYQDEAGNSAYYANTTVLGSNITGKTISVSGKIAGFDKTKNIMIDNYDYYQFTVNKATKIVVTNDTPKVSYSIQNIYGSTVSPTKISTGTYYLVVSGANLSSASSPDLVNYKLTVNASEIISPSLSYSGIEFNEDATSNNGSIVDSITATLSNDTFTGKVGSFLPISTSKVPLGLTLRAIKTSDTTAKITLVGKAYYNKSINSISNLGFTFSNSAFLNNTASTITNSSQSNIKINFVDGTTVIPASLTYNATGFTESTANDGSIASSILVTLANDSFNGTINSSVTGALVNNVPNGLSASILKRSNTSAEIILSGQATAHQLTNSISNLQVIFPNSAFVSGNSSNVSNSTKILNISFADNPVVISRSLSFSSTSFSESNLNNGSINNAINVTVSGDTFTGATNSTLALNTTNLPAGLTATAKKLSDTTAQITLSGSATAHALANSISNLKVIFTDSAFTLGNANGVTNNSTSQSFGISYRDPASLSYSNSIFNESSANNGAIANKITATLTNDIFVGNTGASIDFTAQNVPSGLSFSAIKLDDTHVELSLTGNATAHQNINDINNLQISFNNASFTQNVASAVSNATQSLNVNFDDNVTTPTTNLLDPDNNSTETASNIQNLGLMNSYGQSVNSTIGAPATSTLASDSVDFYQFTLNYDSKVYLNNTSASIANFSVKNNGSYQTLDSTGSILKAGTYYLKANSLVNTQNNYGFSIRAETQPSGNELVQAPVGSTNLSSPYTTTGYYGLLDFGSNQNLAPAKWNSSGTTTSSALQSAVLSTSKAVLYANNTPKINITPITEELDGGHVEVTYISKDELFPRNPNDPIIQSIPAYTNASNQIVINYSFNINNNYNGLKNYNPTNGGTLYKVNTAQSTAIRQAFDEWEKYVNVKFVDVTGTSQDTYNSVNMFIGNVSSDSGAAYVSAYRDTNTNEILKADMWINSGAINSHMTDPAIGNYGYMSIMHEVGHALGLKHPGNYNAGGGGANGPFLTTALDTHQYSIMSYNPSEQLIDLGSTGYTVNGGTTSKFENISQQRALTPSIFDISAVQSLYSINTNATAGNNTYSWNVNQNAFASIYDTGGIDTIDVSNQSKRQIINLNAGTFSSLGAFDLSGITDEYFDANNNLSIGYQTVIENAIGGSGNDIIIGNSVDNVLDGKLGNDTLTGGVGNNTFTFSTTPNASTNLDTIMDFKLGDRINLSLSTFTALNGTAGSTLDATRFSDSTTETSTTRIFADHSVANQVNLYYDSDGNGSASAIKFATLSNFSGNLSSNQFGIIA